MPEQDDEYVIDIDRDEDPSTPNDQRDDYLVRVSRKQIRDLEKKAKGAKGTASEVEQLRRENAMLQAGIDLTTEKGKFFAKGYDGDLDPTKITESATALGIIEQTAADTEAEEEPPDTPLEDGEAALPDQRRALAEGAPADQAPEVDPYEAAANLHDRVKDDGGLEKEAVGAALNSLVNEAAKGNPKVLVSNKPDA